MPIEPEPEKAPRVPNDDIRSGSVTKAPLREYGLDYRVDPTVSFFEYRYWAKIEREEERQAEKLFLERRGPMTPKKMIMSRFSKGVHHENKKMQAQANRDASLTETTGVSPDGNTSDSSLEQDWKTASRAMRTAGWGSIFFLVTTDILGWSGCP